MSDLTRPGVREDDPEGAKFYSYPARQAADGWAYIIDDFGIAYRHGLWPFREDDPEKERQSIASHVRQGEKRGQDWSLGEGCGWGSVRIAPDTEYSNGGQNYVSLWPDLREAWKVSADLDLYVRPQGQGAVVFECTLIIDLRDMSGVITTWPIDGSPIAADGFSEDFPEALKAQADEKRVKILALLAEHVARRDAGKRKIETAHDRYMAGTGR